MESAVEKKKILVIEDEPDVAKLLAARLKSLGYETIIAGEGI
jgi:CheY-like chemotaxis protein